MGLPMNSLRSSCLLLCSLVVLAPNSAGALTWVVNPDGSGDAPTIQAALDLAATGDTLSLGCGTFYENGISLKPGVTILGNDCAVIDAESMNRVLVAFELDLPTEIRGLTLQRGNTGSGGGLLSVRSELLVADCEIVDCCAAFGAAIYSSGGDLTLEGGSIRSCGDWRDTSALHTKDSTTRINGTQLTDCEANAGFVNENAPLHLQGVVTSSFGRRETAESESDVTVVSCDLDGAPLGAGFADISDSQLSLTVECDALLMTNTTGGFHSVVGEGNVHGCRIGGGSFGSGRVESTLVEGSITIGNGEFIQSTVGRGRIAGTIHVQRSLIAYSTVNLAVESVIECTNIYGRWYLGWPEPADWPAYLSFQLPLAGNFSAKPELCNVWDRDYGLTSGSPCLAANNLCGQDVGFSTAVTCVTSSVEQATWSQIKSSYR